MCFAVYIGTSKELEVGEFVPEITDIYLEKPTEEEDNFLRPKFTKRHIYYVGSDTACSCGLALTTGDTHKSVLPSNRKSPNRFIELIKELTFEEDMEYYCCWEGDWHLAAEFCRQIDIKEISSDKNYFGLTEREFIKFVRQSV